MAITMVRNVNALDRGLVLAPERYDVRRMMGNAGGSHLRLADLVYPQRKTVKPTDPIGDCLILDTSDAQEGVVIARKAPVPGSSLGSNKKIAESNDVIISRLRPYLRQVALIDEDLVQDALIACSTEFFVLRPLEGQDIAFLVPYLLTASVQKVLAVSQEGGHHPRFNEGVLLGLPVPAALYKRRDEISKSVREGIRLYRGFQRRIAGCISEVTRALDEAEDPRTVRRASLRGAATERLASRANAESAR